MTARAENRGLRVLLLVPSHAKRSIEADVAADRHPTMDYYALRDSLDADIADYRVVDADTGPAVRAARALGRDAALAMHGFLRRREYDAIYCNGENVAIPLAALFSMVRSRPGHVTIGHRVTPAKKRALLRRLHRHMDTVFVYAGTQQAYAADVLNMEPGKVRFIPFHADHRFYRPLDRPVERMVCSAGLEWRDYPTLIEAVTGLDVEVRLAAASPWSKHADETRRRELPGNVSARRYEYGELRELYAAARFVVVPLYENDFQAGVTTMLEAMAMGKAVIATRTTGQTDVIQDGVNGLYVPPGDAPALRAAIGRLLDDPAEADRLGRQARSTIEASMTLDHWVDRVAAAVCAAGHRTAASGSGARTHGGI